MVTRNWGETENTRYFRDELKRYYDLAKKRKKRKSVIITRSPKKEKFLKKEDFSID